MAAVLSPSYAERALWPTQVEPVAVAVQPLPSDADAVVVGSGYAGLSAATELARRGRSVAVLERHGLGWGASTRNGGMVIPELKAGPVTLERRYGPLGRRLHAEVEEAFDHTEALTAELAAAHGVDCSYRRSGQVWLAHSRRAVPAVRAFVDEHAGEGTDVRFLDGDEVRTEVGSEAFPAGALVARTGGLHPAAFHAGLVQRALDAGAGLHERTAATAITRSSGASAGFRVETERGVVRCRDVLVLTNAYADDLVPALRRRVLPVGSFIVATEVLDPDLAASVIPHDRMLVDTRNFLSYWRLTPDRRLLFGGRRSLAPTTVAQARDFLYARLTSVHPQLAGVAVTHAWGGDVAITLDRLPHVGAVDGVRYATGCNGSGVALNTWLGARLARATCGDAPMPAFAELRHRPLPLWRLRRVYLPAVGCWFRWQDRP